jgi:hypothetical protein
VSNSTHTATLRPKREEGVGRRPQAAISAEARLAAEILRARRQRERVFGANLFADPAWDMMLELFVQEDRGNTVHVSSLCMASAVPTTTALRWIGTLTEAKLIERRPTGSNRKVEICLSRRARLLIRRHLRETLDAVARVACPAEEMVGKS